MYDRLKFLQNTIDSVVKTAKRSTECEIIISSCVDVQDHISVAYDIPVKFVKFDKTFRYGKQLVETLNFCQGEYIMFHEDDDLFLKEKAEIIQSILDSNQNLVAIKDKPLTVKSEDYLEIEEFEKNKKQNFNESSLRTYSIPELTLEQFEALLRDNCVA